MKKISAIFLCIIMALSFSVSAFAEQIKVLIYVNDKLIENAEGRIFYSNTFITARPVMEAMGLKVDWIGEEGCVKVTSDQYVIAFYINHNVVYVQDIASGGVFALWIYKNAEAPLISDGLAYIPLGVVSELTGADLHWEPDPKSVYITYDKNSDRGYSIETLEFMYSGKMKKLAEGETVEIIETTETTTEATTESAPKLVGSSNGKGTLYYDNGNVYTGTLKDGVENGTGTMKYANGNVYEGKWVSGKRQGKGTFTYASGGVYEGEWKNDKHHGKGTLIQANGYIYEGDWENGFKTGTATITYTNGNVYEGEVASGQRQGKGKMTYADGTVEEGTWEKNKFIG